MGYGNCVLTLATPENMEVVGDAGVPYIDEYDLAEKLQRVLRDGSFVQAYRHRAQLRVRTHYDWENVVDEYERLCSRAYPVRKFPSRHENPGESQIRNSHTSRKTKPQKEVCPANSGELAGQSIKGRVRAKQGWRS